MRRRLRIPDLGGARAAILHRPHATVTALVRQLQAIGLEVDCHWPDLPASARAADYLFIDTAGRLHTKSNLMQELEKLHRVIGRQLDGAPHEVLLVLDASTGMNAINQAREFNKAVPLTGLVITKLDGTSKGGMVVAIHNELQLPVKFIGLGEQADDLQPFDPKQFAEAMFAE